MQPAPRRRDDSRKGPSSGPTASACKGQRQGPLSCRCGPFESLPDAPRMPPGCPPDAQGGRCHRNPGRQSQAMPRRCFLSGGGLRHARRLRPGPRGAGTRHAQWLPLGMSSVTTAPTHGRAAADRALCDAAHSRRTPMRRDPSRGLSRVPRPAEDCGAGLARNISEASRRCPGHATFRTDFLTRQ